MYLKELTLRGFKSFASATTLRFEPGITAVVGPNGSGKSNIVDALAWVMGEQGAKNLRGTSMEDVIFSGAPGRAPLGRAQVSLTIDNSDRTLDIDYTEVTISRTIFRNGGSEYAINGTPCRLLDIQELLSDTGLGQQMHVIVGQGRLDAILQADPSGHRAFIEEAAGILKHRRRKERALRKLTSTEANLNRADDMLRELQRQMGPLGRQARVWKRAETIRLTIRDAQARIWADDAQNAMKNRERVNNEIAEVRAQLQHHQRELADVRLSIERLEEASTKASPKIAQANRMLQELSRIQERLRSLAELAKERSAMFASQIVTDFGEDPAVIAKQAEEASCAAENDCAKVEAAKTASQQVSAKRAEIEQRLAQVRRSMQELQQLAKQRDDRTANLRELMTREESARQIAQARSHDLQTQHDELTRQMDELKVRREALVVQRQALTDDDGAAFENARKTLEERQLAAQKLTAQCRQMESRIIALQSKADAIADTLAGRGGAGALDTNAGIDVLGRLADYIHIEEGWEEAIARALDGYAGALVVPDGGDLLRAMQQVGRSGSGRVAVLTPAHGDAADGAITGGEIGNVASGCAAALIHSKDGVDQALAASVVKAVRLLLADVAAVATPQEAAQAVGHGWHRAITRNGEVFAAGIAAYGGAAAQSDLSLAARRDRALHEAETLETSLHDMQAQSQAAEQAVSDARAQVEAEQTKRSENRLRIRQLEDSLQDADMRFADCRRKIAAIDVDFAHSQEDVRSHAQRLEELRIACDALQQSQHDEDDIDGLTLRQRELEQTLERAREDEIAARIALNDASHKAEASQKAANALADKASRAANRRERLEQQNKDRRNKAAYAQLVVQDAVEVAAVMQQSIDRVIARRDLLHKESAGHDTELKTLRERRDAVEPHVERLRLNEHELAVERERVTADLDRLAEQVAERMSCDLEALVAEYGPDQPVTPIATADDDAQPTVYVRQEQVARLNQAKRDLDRLGKVNPLAVEEFEALEARDRYLREQRDDVAKSRDDLMRLIGQLDEQMTETFQAAFDDVAEAFEKVFATLFPGGKGRLRLENPADPLTSGVLVEANPAGTKVRRLSLLSGGERSLTALALLFAIFAARPSPFYVLDEVEAALDDVNLTRLLTALNDLRDQAQLIVITHQQRTMSIADALYGVTMRADGITAVVSQRLDRVA